jgi:F0F1-type ATP synthase membrane subunit c/vacuolar-type H+-ATPase subunit K
VRGLNLAYPLIALSARLRTLAVRLPLRPDAAPAPDSSRSEALTTRCCTFRAGVPIGLTAIITGTVKGRPGRAAAGGVVSKDNENSRAAMSFSD